MKKLLTKLRVISAVSKAQTLAAITTAARITPMTDITELAQSEINNALAQLKQISEYATPSTQYARVLRKYIATLVEALEKAQQRIDELENDEVRQRLANAEHQLYMAELAKNNLRASRKAQFRKRKAAEQRIAELESRTVTVENLQESAYRAGLTAGWNLGLANNNDGFNKCLAAHTAGIKVEAE
ncbi:MULTISPECIES: hypothetical protein [Klebsiella]|uniref:hypothetical protein n=1 Tax=Klebsiella TaxID=570 RepID=UPI001CFAA8B5|nr:MULTISPECIES: hypothetical protein [Klebsiella]MCB4628967.1 hypothetical protein [Klebsiella pneumoniae]MCB4632799.1 hypothetical protein [Klebsiella pneumoniae]MCD5640888.1 hypothetical protein [Klebsiella pneumoniae]MCF0395683.1 hypothetical protein [Klebsiella pneumoniae]MCJ7231465.1 hypothetical protein [Klebsiella pneumoniae]